MTWLVVEKTPAGDWTLPRIVGPEEQAELAAASARRRGNRAMAFDLDDLERKVEWR